MNEKKYSYDSALSASTRERSFYGDDSIEEILRLQKNQDYENAQPSDIINVLRENI